VLRFETTAINRVDFGVADNEGARPTDGGPIDPTAPMRGSRHGTRNRWRVKRSSQRNPGRGVPPRGDAFVQPRALFRRRRHGPGGAAGPVGFLHLPYTPKQVARFLRDGPPEGDKAPITPRALPSMPLETQEAALRLTLAELAGSRD
jgi:pyroglutamyl-peptidase